MSEEEIQGTLLTAKKASDFWRVIAIGIFVIFAVAYCYIIVSLGDIKRELRDIDGQIRLMQKCQDWDAGIITDNQREMLDLLKNHKLTPDDLEKLREEILKK